MRNAWTMSLAVVAAALVLLSPPTGARAETARDGFYNVIAAADFEGGAIPTQFEYKTVSSVHLPALTSPPADAEGHGACVRIATMGTSGQIDNYFRSKYALINSGYLNTQLSGAALEKVQLAKFTCDFLAGDYTNASVAAVSHVDLATRLYVNFVSFTTGGTFKLLNNAVYDYAPNTWYSFVIYVNFQQNTCTVYLNGEPLAENISMGSTRYNYALSFGVRLDSSAANDYIYLDNIGYYTASAPKLSKTRPADGYDDFPVIGGSVEFLYTNTLAEAPESAVCVSSGGETVASGYAVTTEGEKVTVRFQEKLAFAKSYTVTLSGEVRDWLGQSAAQTAVTVKTAPMAVYSSVPVLSDSSGAARALGGGILTASATVGNPLSASAEATLALALYDGDNTMLTCQIASKILSAQSEEDLTVFVDLDDYPDAVCAKAFTVDNLTKMNTLCGEFAWLTLDAAEPSPVIAGGGASLTLDGAELSGEWLTVSGKISKSSPRMIVISVASPSGADCLIAPVYTGADGAFSCSSLLPGGDAVEEGDYFVLVNGRNLSKSAETGVYYLNEESEARLLADINQANSKTKIKSLLADYKKMLNLTDDYLKENGCTILYEQIPCASLDEVRELLVTAQTLLQKLNSVTWSELNALYEDFDQILFRGSAAHIKYGGLSESKQNKINRSLTERGAFSDIPSFRQSFESAVLSAGASSSTGGSSGGSRSASSLSPGSPDVVYLDGARMEEQASPAMAFSDIGEAEWAQDAVKDLYALGILSGDGDNRFRPNDAVTREEFVKLLVTALNIDRTDAACSFTDVEETAWYYPYIAASQEAGIVKGDENGRFGVGSSITRQDMSVLIARAAGVSLSDDGQSVRFSDDGQISEYAKESVYALLRAGIVLGVGDGTFAPRESASRAQAATMIRHLVVAAQKSGEVAQ